VQLDGAGNEVRVDESMSRKGDNSWSWLLRQVGFRTTGSTAFVKIRFGLISADASALDVDVVH